MFLKCFLGGIFVGLVFSLGFGYGLNKIVNDEI